MGESQPLPLVVVGDVHLSHGRAHAIARDLARLVTAHAGHEVVLNGDVFNLSVDAPDRDAPESLAAMVAIHPELRSALRAHLEAGWPVSVVAGNHDAAVMAARSREALLAWLELREDAPLTHVPWLLRRGATHIEHGHFYDPDNAPTHPLAEWTPETEPLGISLVRRFLSPNDALAFVHAYDMTPARGVARAFRLFGPQAAASLMASYFRIAGQLWYEAGRQSGLERERREGEAAVEAYAAAVGVPEPMLRSLLDRGPRPTHHDPKAVFMRLYFDRILACVAGTGAGFTGLAIRSGLGLGVGALGLVYLAISARYGNRYAGLPVRRLRAAASDVAGVTGARNVVFGHTHVDEHDGVYVNGGSFAYPRTGPGRPYVYVDERGLAELRRLNAA